MKLAEMADLLDGLASFLQKQLQKAAFDDLRRLGECLRHFGDETVDRFSTFVIQAKTGTKPPSRRTAGQRAAKADLLPQLAERITRLKENIPNVSYADIHALAQEIGKLTVKEIDELGQRVGRPITGKKKADKVHDLKAWLENLKQGFDQASFTLSGARAPSASGDSAAGAGQTSPPS